MPWYKVTIADQVYVLDPERLEIADAAGRILTAPELIAEWEALGRVEALPDDVDPIDVMRQAQRTDPRS